MKLLPVYLCIGFSIIVAVVSMIAPYLADDEACTPVEHIDYYI